MSAQPDGIDGPTASVSAVAEYVFAQYPHVARRFGRHDLDGQLPEVAERSSTDLVRLRAAATAQLNALPDAADPEVRADLDMAWRVAESERFCVAELGRVHRGPSEWLAETDVSVYLRSPYAPLAERVAAFETHLTGIPEFLRQATQTLPASLPAGERLSGVEQARARAASLDTVVRQLAGEQPEFAGPRLMNAGAAAADACRDFAQAIQASTPVRALLGPELLAEFLRATEGVENPVADLLAEAQAEVDAVARALKSAVAAVGADHPKMAYAMMADHVSAGSVTAALRSAISRLQEFWVAADVVSVDTVNPLVVRPAPQLAGSAKVEFAVSPPLESVRQPHVLYVPEPSDLAGGGGADIAREYLNDPMLEVIAAHEAFAGHYVHVEASAQVSSVLRTCVPWFPGFTEGWAHYVEELAVEHGLADGRPLVKVAQLRAALEAATRLLVFLSVHMRRWSFAEAALHASVICDWSSERAAREVLVVTSDPGGAMYTLGKLRIRQWRREAGFAATGPALKKFHDRIVSCGTVPLPTAWQYFLDSRSTSGEAVRV